MWPGGGLLVKWNLRLEGPGRIAKNGARPRVVKDKVTIHSSERLRTVLDHLQAPKSLRTGAHQPFGKRDNDRSSPHGQKHLSDHLTVGECLAAWEIQGRVRCCLIVNCSYGGMGEVVGVDGLAQPPGGRRNREDSEAADEGGDRTDVRRARSWTIRVFRIQT